VAFAGWRDEAIEFFEGLEAENTKAFWESHKPVYQSEVLAPMQALLADLAPEFGTAKLFRPYRDTRFSADKSPYKTTIAALVGRGGYLQFSADGLGAAVGTFHMAADQLDRYRRSVDSDVAGRDLEKIVARLARDCSSLIGHDVLKTAPRGFPKDHPRIDLLRRKGVAVWHEFAPSDWLASPGAPKVVAAFYRSAAPLRAWLDTHVGDSDVEPR
jgi:uncharacterized protein (TIGR02453 family)